MYSKRLILGVVLLFGLVGCATDRLDTAFPWSRPLGSDLPASRPPAKQEKATQNEIEEPAGTVTLRQALTLALMKNPELQAFSWEVRAREAATLQAGLLPNPVIDAEIEAVRQPETTLQLSQLIELGGKRSKRREIASFTRDLAGWDYEAKRIDVATRVSQAFIDVLGAQQQLALMEETVQLAEQVAKIVSERVKAGKVSPVEETKANVALSSTRIELERARREWDASRKRLAATWGSTAPLFARGQGDLGPVSTIPSLPQLARHLSRNPDLARWAAEISQRQTLVDMEKLRAIPDITMTGGVRRYNTSGDNVFVVGLSIPLPLFNRNQGGTEEARFRLTRAEEERRAAEVRVATLLAEAHGALSTAYGEVTSLEETVLPGAKTAFEAVNEGYRLGKFSLLDVLDAQRTFFGSRSQLLRALTDYHQAVADVERLIGQRLDAVQEIPVMK